VVDGSPQEKVERLADQAFLGGPPTDFERVGRLSFEALLAEGLKPSSRVLDVGCGALRMGYWLMRFLDPGCYFGIEPNREMLDVGLNDLVEADVVKRANAHFAGNDDFDFSVFGEQFDFVLARSIWTHSSKAQIQAMLSSFAATAAPGGVFLASYHPASAFFALGKRWPRAERLLTALPLSELSTIAARVPTLGRSNAYDGEQWVGRSHRSDSPGAARHSLGWIAGEARQRGLKATLAPYPVVNRQYWIRVTKLPQAGADATPGSA
jgi:SAM-dependent methyltransferase